MSLRWFLLSAAVILAFLATFRIGRPRFRLGWASLGCFALAYLVPG